ncbi:hypothetical protein Nepgr_006653 [Nepenthes gracilis]|uniref:Uncharacterized protein n=1 Tax=Nepenthes gracilis TaxID=150966 RepID=A0AAD3XHK2_NEPGR|nr:hypothetical protein Nepgr_006653 [Nepenthes gracilis]
MQDVHRGIEVDCPQASSELVGTWQYAKSRRRRKSKSKSCFVAAKRVVAGAEAVIHTGMIQIGDIEGRTDLKELILHLIAENNLRIGLIFTLHLAYLSPVVPSKPNLDLVPSKLRVSQSECPQLSSSSDSPPFSPSWLPFGRPIPTPLLVRRRCINWLLHIPWCPFPIMLNPLLFTSLAPRSQKHLIAAPALKVSLVSAGHESRTACVSAHSKSEGLRGPSFEPSSQVENGVVLDQVKLPSIQLVGNLESNGPRNSYAAGALAFPDMQAAFFCLSLGIS